MLIPPSPLHVSCVAGFVNLPLSKFEEWGSKLSGEDAILDAEKDTVVMCHHGMRWAKDLTSFHRRHAADPIRMSHKQKPCAPPPNAAAGAPTCLARL